MWFVALARVAVPQAPQPAAHGLTSSLGGLQALPLAAADTASTQAAYEGAKRLGESLGLSGAALGSFMYEAGTARAQGAPASGGAAMERYGMNGIVYA